MTGTGRLQIGLACACAALLVVKWFTLDAINVNWDEFLFLSRVHDHLRGDLATTFQTFHVHLFGWLTAAGANEVDQVVLARRAMFVLRLGACWALFVLARRALGSTEAWFAVLVSLVFSYGWRHGESFRADPLLVGAFVLVAALYVTRPGAWTAAVAGATAALAACISVKAALFAPAALVLAFATRGARVRDAAVAAGVAVVAYAVLQQSHAAGVGAGVADAGARAARVGARMWLEPRTDYLWRTLADDWLPWALAAIGAAMALARARRDRAALVVVALLTPLAALALYRNTFPYFFVLLMPGLALAGGAAAAALARRSALAGGVLALALLAGAVLPATRALVDDLSHQRDLVAVVHDAFPEPVPYLDRAGMVASFPRVGPFMSTFVMAGYRAAGDARVERLVRERGVQFVLADVDALDLSLTPAERLASAYALLPPDDAFLARSFVHLWGPLWVAGVELHSPPPRADVELVVSGRYTVESDGAVVVDGARLADGDRVWLAAGAHTIEAATGVTRVALRLGGARPTAAPPSRWLFVPL